MENLCRKAAYNRMLLSRREEPFEDFEEIQGQN